MVALADPPKEVVSFVRESGPVKDVISISSPSIFSRIKCFLSLDRFAVTPVLPEKLFIVFARLVRFVVNTEALIEALLFTPGLLFKVKEIVPSLFGGGNFTLVIALASTPKVEAFELTNPATYPAEDSIGTVMSTALLVVVEFTVKVYAAVT